MRDIPICVPCYRKGECKTLDIVPDAMLFMDSQDYPVYRAKYPDANIVVVPDEAQGNCPRIHNYILDYMFEEKGHDALCFMDDDIYDIYRLGVEKTEYGSRGKVKNSVIPYLHEFIEKHTLVCEEFGFKLWGLLQIWNYADMAEYKPFSFKGFIGETFCVHLRHDLRYDEDLFLFEEYDMIIKQCNKYRGILRLNTYGLKFGLKDAVGGSNLYRSSVTIRTQGEKLMRKYGNVLRKNPKAPDDVYQLRIPIRGL